MCRFRVQVFEDSDELRHVKIKSMTHSGISLVGCQELGSSSPVFSSNLTLNLEVNRRRVRNCSRVPRSECEAPIVGFADALHFRTNGCQSSCWYYFINAVLLVSLITLKMHAHTCYSCGILWKVTIELYNKPPGYWKLSGRVFEGTSKLPSFVWSERCKCRTLCLVSLHPVPWLFPTKPALPLIVFFRWTAIDVLLLTLF